MQQSVGFGRRTLNAVINYIRSTYKSLWLVLITCSVFSCMLVYSSTLHTGSSRSVLTQAIASLIGFAAMIVISLMDYERLAQLWPIIAIVCVGMVGLTFIVGQRASGEYSLADDQAWLNIFGISFQPSELMKIGFIVTFSYHLSNIIKNNKLNSMPHLLLLAAHIAFPVMLIMAQGDDGTALMFMSMALIIIIGSGLNWKYLVVGFTVVLMSLPVLWQFMTETQKERFRVVYNPQPGDEQAGFYQQYVGRIAVGSGGLSGQGWLNGAMTQSGVVPADHNDFIFAVVCEEFGFIGAMFTLLLLVALMIMCIKTALAARDDLGRFMCLGFFGIIAAQTVFNLGMVLCLLPVIGITLPFFSAGGSSSMCLYFGVGLVLSVYMRRGESRMQIAI